MSYNQRNMVTNSITKLLGQKIAVITGSPLFAILADKFGKINLGYYYRCSVIIVPLLKDFVPLITLIDFFDIITKQMYGICFNLCSDLNGIQKDIQISKC